MVSSLLEPATFRPSAQCLKPAINDLFVFLIANHNSQAYISFNDRFSSFYETTLSALGPNFATLKIWVFFRDILIERIPVGGATK